MNKHKPEPLPSLPADSRDPDKKTRRRRSRRPSSDLAPDSDGASSSCPNGPRDGFSSRRRDSPAHSRPFRSPSPSCTPNPSFRSKGCEIAATTAGLEQCAIDSGLQQLGISSSPSGTPGNAISRSGCGISIPSKFGSKESSPLPIPKSKGKESGQTSSSRSDSYSGKGPFSKADKFRYSPKVKVDTPRDTRSSQFCNYAEDAVLGSGLFPEEARASNACCECRSSGEDGDSGASWQESKFYGSPTTRFCVARAPTSRNDRGSTQRSYFPSYWPLAKVDRALEAGELFRARIRINAHNRNEAYISLDGVPTDILIDGARAQNRAIDGDVVAIRINPVSAWPKLRGSLDKQTSSDITAVLTDGLTCNNNVASTEIPDCSSDEAQSDTIEYTEEATTSGRSVETAMGISSEAQFKDSKVDMTSEIASNSNCHSNTQNRQSKYDPREQQQYGFLQPEINEACASSKAKKASDDLAACVGLLFDKRPTGEVVAILEKSNRREAVIGFLEHQKFGNKCREESSKKFLQNGASTIMLFPSDNKFPKMVVSVNALPSDLKKRFYEGDMTLGSELVAAHVADWRPDSFAPDAIISHSLGQGGEIEAQTAAILFEHAVHSAEFPLATLECLPKMPWKIPSQEWKKRRDLRRCRVFSIDPPTARDLDDALSIERLENGLVRVGVHIADVSYFVHPDTALDKEAQVRSTSVYLIRSVLPMLPPVLSEELCSLNPGVDRLTLSVIWDHDALGQIVDHWIGRTIIRSCCKLSYNHSQEMIDGKFDAGNDTEPESCTIESMLPELHGSFKWSEIIEDVKALHGIAKQRRDQRFQAGALRLDNAKLVFALDEDGIPTDSNLYEHQDSNFLVEEFMLLANMTVAKVISGAFPDCALLRRHPEPNLRKMKELEEFCNKNGFELDTSSSGALHESLRKLRGGLKEDPVLCSILMLYATKPMQLAKYFSTGELKDKEEEWVHYALATPFYTHFTSPIRRYPDILVHRTLMAVLEAEDILSGSHGSPEKTPGGVISVKAESTQIKKCFTGLSLDKQRAESPAGQKALATAASKHRVLGSLQLAMVADHCNERKLASRNVKDASDKLYLWAMLKKRNGILSEARVLAVGPKFVSLYVHKIAMERRIYYEETEGLKLEWFHMTGTLVLDLVSQKGSLKKQRQGRSRAVADVAVLVNPADGCNGNSDSQIFEDLISELQERVQDNLSMHNDSVLEPKLDNDIDKKLDPAVLPLTLRLLAPVPVYVYAVGGENRPLDIAVRLYLSSYMS